MCRLQGADQDHLGRVLLQGVFPRSSQLLCQVRRLACLTDALPSVRWKSLAPPGSRFWCQRRGCHIGEGAKSQAVPIGHRFCAAARAGPVAGKCRYVQSRRLRLLTTTGACDNRDDVRVIPWAGARHSWSQQSWTKEVGCRSGNMFQPPCVRLGYSAICYGPSLGRVW